MNTEPKFTFRHPFIEGEYFTLRASEIESEYFELMSREALIRWLEWNDPNGTYSDADCALDDCEPLTREDLINMAQNQFDGE